MKQQYEYEGQPLNRPIIREILRKCLIDSEIHRKINPQQKWLSVREFGENICHYHEQNGGAPIQLLDTHTPFYGRLRELEGQDKAERYRSSGKDLWKLIPSYENESPDRRLVRVIQQERERLGAEIETLRQRVTQLDIILSEYEQ